MATPRTVEEQARKSALDIFEALAENDLGEEALEEAAESCWPAGSDDYDTSGRFSPDAEVLREALFRATAAHLSVQLLQRSLGFIPGYPDPVTPTT